MNIRRLNLQYAVFNIAQRIPDLFIGAILYEKGLALPLVFLFFIVVSATKNIFRFLVSLPLVRKYGLMAGVVGGVLQYALFYLLFSLTHQLSVSMLMVFAVANGLVGTMYWVAVHPLYAQTSQLEQDGRNIGYRDAFIRIGSIIVPVVGGFVAANWGPGSAFVVAAAVALVSLAPLIGQRMPANFSLQEARLSNLKLLSRDSFFIGFYDGVVTSSEDVVWALVVFLLFGQSYVAFGVFFAFVMFIRAMGNVAMGHAVDKQYRQKMFLAVSVIAVIIVMAAKMFLRTVEQAIAVDAVFMLALAMYHPIFLTAFYRIHRNSANPLLSVAVSDTGYDTATLLVAIVAGLLTWLGASMQLAMGLGLLAMIGNWFLLKDKVQRTW
jgi:hypothetical protein